MKEIKIDNGKAHCRIDQGKECQFSYPWYFMIL